MVDVLIVVTLLTSAGIIIARLKMPYPLPLVFTAVLVIIAAVIVIDLLLNKPLWLQLLRR